MTTAAAVSPCCSSRGAAVWGVPGMSIRCPHSSRRGTPLLPSATAALSEQLGLGPTRIVAASMGGYIAQELMLARPELVSQAALIATRGRLDRTRELFRQAESELAESGVQLPTAYEAKVR